MQRTTGNDAATKVVDRKNGAIALSRTPEELRRFYAAYVCGQGEADGARIRAAFEAIPRENFSGSGPWKVRTAGGYIDTPSDDLCYLYQDILIAIDADRGVNNGQPSLHARSIEAAAPQEGDRVLHVGAGMGYYSAILARLVGASGHVEAREIDAATATRAQRCLSDYANVTVLARSGSEPDLPTSDVIYVNAGAPKVMEPWLDALGEGGRLVFPLTSGFEMGGMLLVTRQKAGFSARFVGRAAFIPCIGAEDTEAGKRLTHAFGIGRAMDVKSLVRSPESPNASCWLAGDGWWLSTRALAGAG